MQYPNFPDKHSQKAHFSPSDFVDYIHQTNDIVMPPIPESAILVFQRRLMNYVSIVGKAVPVKFMNASIYEISEYGKPIWVVGNFGIGAPVSVIILEELLALGIKQCAIVGAAGTLQTALSIGDLVVCQRAVRDEGTSYHYLSPTPLAEASKKLTQKIVNHLKNKQQKFARGTSWTVDAPYRETRAEIQHYQNRGVLTVEMEAAALFAVAQYRQTDMAALFVISDSLAAEKWQPGFHTYTLTNGLVQAFRLMAEILTSD